MLMKRENRDGRRRRGLSPLRHPLPRAYIKSIFRGKLPPARVFFSTDINVFPPSAPSSLSLYIYIYIHTYTGVPRKWGEARRRTSGSRFVRFAEGTNNETASNGYLAC